MTTTEKLKEIKKEMELKNVNDIEYYYVLDNASYGHTSHDTLHTDMCRYTECLNEGDEIIDYGILTPEEYDETIEANCCSSEQEDDIMIVVLKKTI